MCSTYTVNELLREMREKKHFNAANKRAGQIGKESTLNPTVLNINKELRAGF